MKKFLMMIILAMVIGSSPHVVFAREDVQLRNSDVIERIKAVTEDMVGADPMEVKQMSDDYFVVADYHGVFIFEQMTGKPIGAIDARSLNIKTQGDDTFEYKLDGDILYLKPVLKEICYQYHIKEATIKNTTHKVDFTLKQKRMENFNSLPLEKDVSFIQGLKTDKTFVLSYVEQEFNNPLFVLGTNDRRFIYKFRFSDCVNIPQILQMSVNGQKVSEALSFEGKWYVPLRKVAEKLGFQLTWNPIRYEASVEKGKEAGTINVKDGVYLFNGKQEEIKSKPLIKNGYTYVPIDYVTKVLGHKLHLDLVKKTLEIE